MQGNLPPARHYTLKLEVCFCVRGVTSPLLANIYLHYVFDLWAKRWREHHAHGQVIIVRYADDIVVGFEHEAEAKRFQMDLQQRMEKFALSLHPDKTRLIEFGRFAARDRVRRAGWVNRRRSSSLVSFISAAARARGTSSSSGSHARIACGPPCGKSRRRCGGACMTPSRSRESGWRKWYGVTSTTMRCRPMPRACSVSATS